MNDNALIIPENHWANSQLSIARFCGRISINKELYVIVNKEGIDVYELSNPDSKHFVGEGNWIIPPGEPCDLCHEKVVPLYKLYHRDKVLQAAKAVKNRLERFNEFRKILKHADDK